MNEWVMKKGRLWRRVIYLPNSPWHNWYGYPLPGGPSSYLAAMLVMLGSHHKMQWLALPLHEPHRKSVICSAWQFLWCKYPNHGQFQATLVMSLNLTSQRKPAPANHCTWVSSRLGSGRTKSCKALHRGTLYTWVTWGLFFFGPSSCLDWMSVGEILLFLHLNCENGKHKKL